jgi:hypothetical protein
MTTTPTRLDLHRLANEINDREKAIDQLKRATIGKAGEAVTEAILQGQALIKAKANIPHGLWLDWLKANCPNISQPSASRYMTIAANYSRVNNIEGAESLRQALALCSLDEHGKPKEIKQWPADLLGLNRLSKFVGFVSNHPINAWPEGSRDQLRQDMEPIARQLWPERWAAL